MLSVLGFFISFLVLKKLVWFVSTISYVLAKVTAEKQQQFAGYQSQMVHEMFVFCLVPYSGKHFWGA